MPHHVHLPPPVLLPAAPPKAEVRRRRLRPGLDAEAVADDEAPSAFGVGGDTGPNGAGPADGRGAEHAGQGGSAGRPLTDGTLRTVLQGQEQG